MRHSLPPRRLGTLQNAENQCAKSFQIVEVTECRKLKTELVLVERKDDGHIILDFKQYQCWNWIHEDYKNIAKITVRNMPTRNYKSTKTLHFQKFGEETFQALEPKNRAMVLQITLNLPPEVSFPDTKWCSLDYVGPYTKDNYIGMFSGKDLITPEELTSAIVWIFKTDLG